jgi:F-type H+-transporting ATPase subunit a
MTDMELLAQPIWKPFAWFGLEHDFFNVNATTVINTWAVLLILLITLIIFRIFLTKKQSVLCFLILSGITSFIDLVTQTLGTFIYKHFAIIFSLFIFILSCNWMAIIPWAAEPTNDFNTTLALGLVSFIYKEIEGIKVTGFWSYLLEFFHPFFLMFPINLIGHFSKIISISFRLFGNIFGGAIIMELYQHAIASSIIFEIAGLLSGMNFLILIFFGLFEGLIQAFVFAMLSLTYLALAIQEEPTGET